MQMPKAIAPVIGQQWARLSCEAQLCKGPDAILAKGAGFGHAQSFQIGLLHLPLPPQQHSLCQLHQVPKGRAESNDDGSWVGKDTRGLSLSSADFHIMVLSSLYRSWLRDNETATCAGLRHHPGPSSE